MSRFQSSYLGLVALIILASSTIPLRTLSGFLAYTVSAVASITILNLTLLLASGSEYRGLIVIYSGYVFFVSLMGVLRLLGVTGYLLDLGYIVVMLLLLTMYYHNTGLHEILTAELPVILLVSVILGVYIGLSNPLRYAVTALVDAISLIIVSYSSENSMVFFATSLLLFTILYTMSTLTQSTMVFILMFSVYIVRTILILLRRISFFKAILILDILLRPILVAYL